MNFYCFGICIQSSVAFRDFLERNADFLLTLTLCHSVYLDSVERGDSYDDSERG